MKKLISVFATLFLMAACSFAYTTNDVSVGSGNISTGPTAHWLVNTVSTVTTAAGADDYYVAFNIPAGCMVHAVAYKATTIAGATCTVDIGDTSSATTYVTAGNMETVTTWTLADTPTMYAAANKIRVQFNNATAVCVMKVAILVSQLP